VSLLADHPGWVAGLRAQADRPPLRPRVPLWWQGTAIGSVEPELLNEIRLQPAPDGRMLLRKEERGWCLEGELTRTLDQLAQALREAGIARAWRDEQLAVTDDAGRVLGTVERAVVRPLGIATRAVHLLGFAPDGRQWVQLRALTKPNDPGLWDTLMGGMVPACDTVAQALERETWEEAGLRLPQLQDLQRGGAVTLRTPTGDGGPGYVIERIDWYRCRVPDGVVPANQDGEVDEFRAMTAAELARRMLAAEFTREASLILVEAGL
jgi:8-oxo-dGTP pyrophosphatase MutT (NUDIX family)